MKTRIEMSFHGEPSKTTRRMGLTEWISANANRLSHIIFKIHMTHNLFGYLEEEAAMLKSMEAAGGLVAAA